MDSCARCSHLLVRTSGYNQDTSPYGWQSQPWTISVFCFLKTSMFLSDLKDLEPFPFLWNSSLTALGKLSLGTDDGCPEKRVVWGAGQCRMQRNFPTVLLLEDSPSLMAHPPKVTALYIPQSSEITFLPLTILLECPQTHLNMTVVNTSASSNRQIHVHLTLLFFFLGITFPLVLSFYFYNSLGAHDGSVGKGACCQAWQPEFNPWTHIWKNNQVPHCPLASECVPWYACVHVHPCTYIIKAKKIINSWAKISAF